MKQDLCLNLEVAHLIQMKNIKVNLKIHLFKKYHSTTDSGAFHTRIRVRVMLITEDPTVTVKYRTVIKHCSFALIGVKL